MADDKYNRGKAGKRSKESLGAMWANIKSRENSGTGKAVKKQMSKKTNQTLVISIILCLVAGVLIGYFVLGLFTKNDCFVMNEYTQGAIDVYIGEDGGITEYTEKGVKCVAFGQDISKDVVVTYKYREDLSFDVQVVDKVDETTPGIYYAVYSVNNIRYMGLELIRNIIVLREEV